MMPLTLANTCEVNTIKKIGGNPEVKSRLETMGFVVGSEITLISSISGNVIVSIKDTRVAISKEMAQKIMI